MAHFFEPVGEGVGIKRFATMRHQKGQVFGWRGVESYTQIRVQRDCQRLSGLALADMQQTGPQVLPPQLDYISASLRRVQQQRKRKARACADGMLGLESRNVFLGPTLEATRAKLGAAHTDGWIVTTQAAADGVAHEAAERNEEIQCSPGLSYLGVDHALYMHARKRSNAFVTMLLAEPLENAAPRNAARLCQRGKSERTEIASDRCCDSARFRAPQADLKTVAASRQLIGGHKLGRPGQAGQGDTFVAWPAKIEPCLAVTLQNGTNDIDTR